MNSKIRPSHLAGGVAFLVALVPVVALMQIDFGPDPGPVIRIKLSDPVPYVPEEAMVSPVSGEAAEGGDGSGLEGSSLAEGASASGRPAASPASTPTPNSGPEARRTSSSRRPVEADQAASAEPPRPEPMTRGGEREPVTVPRMVSPVRVAPRPAPSEVVRRVDVSPSVTSVSPAQRPREDVQDEEQASGEDVSPTEAAREALRDVRPR